MSSAAGHTFTSFSTYVRSSPITTDDASYFDATLFSSNIGQGQRGVQNRGMYYNEFMVKDNCFMTKRSTLQCKLPDLHHKLVLICTLFYNRTSVLCTSCSKKSFAIDLNT